MKNREKNLKISARREFYMHLEKIKDMYENQGFKFAAELYKSLNLQMSLWSFNHYFNKEIKSKNLKSQIENSKNTKQNEPKKEQINEKSQSAVKVKSAIDDIMTPEGREEAARRYNEKTPEEKAAIQKRLDAMIEANRLGWENVDAYYREQDEKNRQEEEKRK